MRVAALVITVAFFALIVAPVAVTWYIRTGELIGARSMLNSMSIIIGLIIIASAAFVFPFIDRPNP